MQILICGAGAIGSNLVKNLVPDLKGEHEITILDNDKVEERNVTPGTQFYTPDQIGLSKVEALQFNIHQNFQREIKIINKEIMDEYDAEILFIPEELMGRDNQTDFNPFGLVIDCLDNFMARNDVQNACVKNGLPCLHVGFSPDFTFAIEWAENYKVPSDIIKGIDICEMLGAAAFVASVASLGALAAEEFIFKGQKIEIVGGKFSHSLIK